jgi:PKD repeat protein
MMAELENKDGNEMKRKNRQKTKIPIYIVSLIILITIFNSIPTTFADDQIIVSFDPYIVNTPPFQPVNVYPPNGSVNVNTPVTLRVDVYDNTSDTVDVYFYDASDDSLIGTEFNVNVSANWTTASVTWNNLNEDTIYRWYAIANDSEYENRSETWRFITASSGGGGGGGGPPAQNQKPVAKITGPDTGYVNQTLIFSAQLSYDPDGTITDYRWDFDNDGLFEIDSIEDSLVIHTYLNPGNYTIKLVVIDNDGENSTDFHKISITQLEPHQQLPIVKANGPYIAYTNENITFNSSGTYDPDGTIINYTWNFGDKNTSYQENPIHSYSKPGNYIAFLTVVDNDSLSNSAIASVYIRKPEPKEKEQPLLTLLILIIAIIATNISVILESKRRRRNLKSNNIKKPEITNKNVLKLDDKIDKILIDSNK